MVKSFFKVKNNSFFIFFGLVPLIYLFIFQNDSFPWTQFQIRLKYRKRLYSSKNLMNDKKYKFKGPKKSKSFFTLPSYLLYTCIYMLYVYSIFNFFSLNIHFRCINIYVYIYLLYSNIIQLYSRFYSIR